MATKSDAALVPHVLAHYQLMAPLIEASFAETPVVFVNYPNGVRERRRLSRDDRSRLGVASTITC